MELFAVAGGAEGAGGSGGADGKPFCVAAEARPECAALCGFDCSIALVLRGGELLAGELELLILCGGVLLGDGEFFAALFAGFDGAANRREILLRNGGDGGRRGLPAGQAGILRGRRRNGDGDRSGERQLPGQPLRDLLRRLNFADGVAHRFELRLESGVALHFLRGERGGLLLRLIHQFRLGVESGLQAEAVVVGFEPGGEREGRDDEKDERRGNFDFCAESHFLEARS